MSAGNRRPATPFPDPVCDAALAVPSSAAALGSFGREYEPDTEGSAGFHPAGEREERQRPEDAKQEPGTVRRGTVLAAGGLCWGIAVPGRGYQWGRARQTLAAGSSCPL
mmetsp:Transcript_135765/g.307171  ORF Transcript_135765/g.307171 Transcript_135765/m.307171 type:complete len:109 (+) Transcript_135765:1-327(+)